MKKRKHGYFDMSDKENNRYSLYYSFIEEIDKEFEEASKRWPMMHSPHEGCAIVQEEVEELWAAVKNNHLYSREDKLQYLEKIRKEAKQVATMAIRFLVDSYSMKITVHKKEKSLKQNTMFTSDACDTILGKKLRSENTIHEQGKPDELISTLALAFYDAKKKRRGERRLRRKNILEQRGGWTRIK